MSPAAARARRTPRFLGVVCLVSGSGSTLQNLLDESAAGRLPARIRAVISSREDAGALERARRAGVPTAVVDRRAHPDVDAFSRALAAAIARHRPDLVAMAGFLHLWRIPPKLRGRVLNIHPALLPAFGGKGFYGDRVHRAVLAAGVPESGCTVHVADDRYDRGPIVLQRRVPVLPGDTVETLRARVQAAERDAYPEVIRWFAEGRVRIDGARVRIEGPLDVRSAREVARPARPKGRPRPGRRGRR